MIELLYMIVPYLPVLHEGTGHYW